MIKPIADHVLTLRDGRSLGCAEWGVPDGPVVVFLHGTPACRLWCPDVAATTAAGCRVFTLDRPGYGRSEPPPSMSLRVWTEDVVEFADLVEIDRFAVVGWSAGGIYAAACAASIPDRVVAAGVAGGVFAGVAYPPDELADDSPELGDQDRRIRSLARRDPYLARELTAELYAEEVAHSVLDPLEVLWEGAPQADLRYIADPDVAETFRRVIHEGLRQGAWGDAWAGVARVLPWGFSLEDIAVKFHLWHGAQDPFASLADMEYWASRIPSAQITVFEGSGHLVVEDHWSEILASVLE